MHRNPKWPLNQHSKSMSAHNFLESLHIGFKVWGINKYKNKKPQSNRMYRNEIQDGHRPNLTWKMYVFS